MTAELPEHCSLTAGVFFPFVIAFCVLYIEEDEQFQHGEVARCLDKFNCHISPRYSLVVGERLKPRRSLLTVNGTLASAYCIE